MQATSNLDKYIDARSCLDEAIAILETIQVGTNKDRYKTIERIIEKIESCKFLTEQLTESEQKAANEQ